MQQGAAVALLYFFTFNFLPLLVYGSIITRTQPLAEGQTLVSPGQIFEMGFFFSSANNKFVGLWYKGISPRKYVWVANRDKPLAATDRLASLRIGSNGSLELVDGGQTSVWSINKYNCSSALLLDDGNFVVKDVAGAVIWESFDNPSDTLLPGMLEGYDSVSGKRNLLTSWKSENDPSLGLFFGGLSEELPTQLSIWRSGSSTPHWRGGPWDQSKFIGIPAMDSLDPNPFSLIDNVTQGRRYFSFSYDKIPGDRVLPYMDLSPGGSMRFFSSEGGSNWISYWESSASPCDDYGACGPFGVCKPWDSPICKCLKGFVPKSNEEWSNGNWTRGCVRRTNLSCASATHTNESVSDGFFKLEKIKVPDFHKYITSLRVDKFDDCKKQCLDNCICLAYAYVDNIGCLLWFKDLIDLQHFPSFGQDLYVRLAHSELDEGKPIKLIASLTSIGWLCILLGIVCSLYRWRANKKRQVDLGARSLESTSMLRSYRDSFQEFMELKMYDFDSILIATDSFSITNKLGEGGFGPVYKGKLPKGKEIAVKRLSSSSRQGVEEFKNEVMLISHLQHKNLVRMMGCSVKEDEKLLIYEFMPNKSLDNFLYDPTKIAVLTWATRFNIIQGVARGLLYLHHDSYVKVIHRDLKVSNILLDEKMIPKISDFGLARIVEQTQSVENTLKVVGTRGYMSPEYAMAGIFSEKSDVYSFGILVLEIISGKKNTSFYSYDQQLGLLPYAWNSWINGRVLELVDETLGDLYSSSEVITCMHVGLLCVQDNAVDRPTMVDVASMLSNEKDGPDPKKPLFTMQYTTHHPQQLFKNTNSSKNEVSITMIQGR